MTLLQVSEDYMYHGTPSPWLQTKILRLLQVRNCVLMLLLQYSRCVKAVQAFPIPPTPAMRTRLNEVLNHILNKTEVSYPFDPITYPINQWLTGYQVREPKQRGALRTV
jgi:hypothetical protein